MANSPTPAIHVVLDTTICADDALDALLLDRKVYSLEADEDARKPYIILGSVDEDGRGGVFNGSLLGTVTDIKIHGANRTAQEVQAIYSNLNRLLNFTKLNVDGFTFVQGRLKLITILPPERPGAEYGATLLAEYEVLTNGPR